LKVLLNLGRSIRIRRYMLIPLTPVTLGPCLLDGPTGFPQDIERVS